MIFRNLTLLSSFFLLCFSAPCQVKILGIDMKSNEYGFKNGSIFEIDLNANSRTDRYEFKLENNIYNPYFADFVSSQNKLYGVGYTPPKPFSRGFFELNLDNDSIIFFQPSDTSILAYLFIDVFEKNPDTLLVLHNHNIYTVDLTTNTYFVSDYLESQFIGIQDGFHSHPNGKLYGVSSYGSFTNPNHPSYSGCIFSYSPNTGQKSYTFFDSAVGVGEHPVSGLTLAQDGKFYGATISGSLNGRGSIFRYDPSLDTVEALFPFPSNLQKLGIVNQALVEAVPNVFYGILHHSAPTTNDSTGALFRYDLNNQIFEILHVFRKNTVLTFPDKIVKLGNGRIYGTSRFENITAFTFDHFTNQINFVAPLDGIEFGYYPSTLISYDSNTVLISTLEGGSDNQGALTEFKANSSSYSRIMNYCESDVGMSNRPYLEFDDRGMLIGNTYSGKANDNGAIFQYDTASHRLTDTFELNQIFVKHERLSSLTFNKYDQRFYGITDMVPSYGNAFKILSYDPQANVARINKQFNSSFGNPDLDITIGGAGNIYGHRLNSTNGLGAIYKYDIISDQILNLKVFSDSNINPLHNPVHLKGKLVGFIIDNNTTVPQTKIYHFNLSNSNYQEVLSIPMPSNNQYFQVIGKVISNGANEAYGIMQEWLPDSLRSAFLFRYNVDNNQFSLIHEFNENHMNTEGQFNYFENVRLLYDPISNSLIGKTSRGGHFNYGTIFQFDLSQNSFSTVFNSSEYVGGMGFANSMSLLVNLEQKKDLIFSSLRVYPNPASESLKVEYNLNADNGFDFNIFNIQGILIRNFRGNVKESSFDISKLSPGLYTYEIVSGEGKKRGKFVKN